MTFNILSHHKLMVENLAIGTIGLQAALRLLYFAFHAPFTVQPIHPGMGVRNPSTAAHPALLACPGLLILEQPIRRGQGSQDLFFDPSYP